MCGRKTSIWIVTTMMKHDVTKSDDVQLYVCMAMPSAMADDNRKLKNEKLYTFWTITNFFRTIFAQGCTHIVLLWHNNIYRNTMSRKVTWYQNKWTARENSVSKWKDKVERMNKNKSGRWNEKLKRTFYKIISNCTE